jgi:hypothetical protein
MYVCMYIRCMYDCMYVQLIVCTVQSVRHCCKYHCAVGYTMGYKLHALYALRQAALEKGRDVLVIRAVLDWQGWLDRQCTVRTYCVCFKCVQDKELGFERLQRLQSL